MTQPPRQFNPSRAWLFWTVPGFLLGSGVPARYIVDIADVAQSEEEGDGSEGDDDAGQPQCAAQPDPFTEDASGQGAEREQHHDQELHRRVDPSQHALWAKPLPEADVRNGVDDLA